jgi:D-xylose transport system ATP-binding protein
MIGREITNMYPQRESKIGREVLRVENLTVDHPYIANTNLIENVSFTVHEGEVVGLAGLVGAGRSEVCMAVYGLAPAKSGKIFLRGQEIKIRNTSHAVKQKIGMISEDRKRFGLNFVWDIKHNIAISNLDTLVKGPFVSSQEMLKRVTPYYEKLRIKAPSLNTKVTTLSGGNQQKVVIARSLNTLPELIILDEPTKGIDVGSKNEIYHLINDLASRNVAIVMISSELPELMAMCDRFVVMAEGRVTGELSKSEATETKIMEKSVLSFKTGQQELNNG